MKKLLTICAAYTLITCVSIYCMDSVFNCDKPSNTSNLSTSWKCYMEGYKNKAIAQNIIKNHGTTLRTLSFEQQMPESEKLVKNYIQNYVKQIDSKESKKTVKRVMNRYTATITLQVLGQLSPQGQTNENSCPIL